MRSSAGIRALIGLAACFLGAGPCAAQESRSASFSNIKQEGGAVIPALPANRAPRVEVKMIAPRPQLVKVPIPIETPFPWALAGAAAAFAGAAAVFRSKRRGAGEENLALAAHELKSPLAALESYLALIEREGQGGGTDLRAWLSDVARMRTTAAHLRGTITDILDMASLQEGRLKLQVGPLSLQDCARAAADSYRALAAERKIALNVDGPPARALGDPARVRQIMDNLLGNALRFTPAGGAVTMTSFRSGARAGLSVSDTGVGVPAAARPRLFGRFARLSAPLHGDAGTGLGLYIGRRLAQLQAGSLDYAPAGGGGSVFTLTLPADADS
ncbi:MAG: HAMP domain-containing histidine kinase [Elusimicrobia bacterium]|nr:HAMP domain-containing histidine kinase [Elusimicrobiota bacterium]